MSEEPQSEDVSTGASATIVGPESATSGVSEVERLRAEVDDLKDKLLRAKAEAQNAVRRAANSQTEAVRYGNANLLKALVPAIDDLDRMLNSERPAEIATLLDGVKLIYTNLMKVLREFDLTVIEASGENFNPQVHQAVGQQPSADVPEGMVLHELQKGYRLHDRTLRPARVVVSSGQPINS